MAGWRREPAVETQQPENRRMEFADRTANVAQRFTSSPPTPNLVFLRIGHAGSSLSYQTTFLQILINQVVLQWQGGNTYLGNYDGVDARAAFHT